MSTTNLPKEGPDTLALRPCPRCGSGPVLVTHRWSTAHDIDVVYQDEQVGHTMVRLDWVDRGELLRTGVRWTELASIEGHECADLEPWDERPAVAKPWRQEVHAHGTEVLWSGQFALACRACQRELPETDVPELFVLLGQDGVTDADVEPESGDASQ